MEAIKKRVANRLKYLDAQVDEKDRGSRNKDLKRIQKQFHVLDIELAKAGVSVPSSNVQAGSQAVKLKEGEDLRQEAKTRAEEARLAYANLAEEVEGLRKQQQQTEEEGRIAVNKLRAESLDARIRNGFETSQRKTTLQRENDALRKCLSGARPAKDLVKLLAQ